MIITLSPIASNITDKVSVSGDSITVNDVEYDLSLIPDGGEVKAELPAIGTIRRISGVINLTVGYNYDSSIAESNQSSNINDYVFDVESGEVPSPIKLLDQTEADNV